MHREVVRTVRARLFPSRIPLLVALSGVCVSHGSPRELIANASIDAARAPSRFTRRYRTFAPSITTDQGLITPTEVSVSKVLVSSLDDLFCELREPTSQWAVPYERQ